MDNKLQKLAQLELARRAIARELAEEEMERVAGGGVTEQEVAARWEDLRAACKLRTVPDADISAKLEAALAAEEQINAECSRELVAIRRTMAKLILDASTLGRGISLTDQK